MARIPDNIVKEKNWYEKTVEPRWGAKRAEPIRRLAALLRNNGFNTTASCGHEMWVVMEFYLDKDITRLRDLLLENGYTEFRITAWHECRESFIFRKREMKLELLQNKKGRIIK